MYQEWASDVKEANWDRKKHPKTGGMRWIINNPKDQKVIVGLSGASDRMFMDGLCKTKQKLDHLPFSLVTEKKKKQTLIKDDYGNHGIGWLKGTPGFGWLIFDKLP